MSDSEKVLNGKLDTLVAMLERKDMALLDELWNDDGFLLVASEKGEICRTRVELAAKLRALFSSPATFSFDWPERKVTIVGDVAWIFAEGYFIVRQISMQEVRRPYLACCIFDNLGGGWRWRQFFGSEPA